MSNFFLPRGEYNFLCAHEPIKCLYLARAQLPGTCPFTSIGHVFLTNQNRGHSLGTKKKLGTICIDQSESWAQTWAQYFARAYSESQSNVPTVTFYPGLFIQRVYGTKLSRFVDVRLKNLNNRLRRQSVRRKWPRTRQIWPINRQRWPRTSQIWLINRQTWQKKGK